MLKYAKRVSHVFQKRAYKLCTAIILCILTSTTIIFPSVCAVNIDSSKITKIADTSTMDTYQDKLISETNGSRYVGRVWTDKSVFTGDINLDYDTDGYTGTIKNDGEFLHAFSTLGASQSWVGLPPAKTVIIIDNSGSMYSNSTTFVNTRVYKTITSVNKAIDELMRAGSYNEVSVVLFGNGRKNGIEQENHDTAEVIMPMGHYPISNDKNNPYKYLDCGWASKNSDDVPANPVQDYSIANNGSGYVYVDKMYVNDRFEVNSSLNTDNRYDTYKNGTTNIHAGFYVGFQELLKAKKEVVIDGYKFGYVPNMVCLTDGAATDMLQGIWSDFRIGKNILAYGYTNDRGNKNAKYTEEWRESDTKWTYDWNMYMHLTNKNGVQTLEQVGYGDGGLTQSTPSGSGKNDVNPDSTGRTNMEEFAKQVRSTQGAILFSTLMTNGYAKAAVKKEYGSDCKVYTISVDMTDPNDIDLTSPTKNIASGKEKITTNPPTVNPNEYFNKEWLKDKGYIKQTADLDNLTEDDFIYEPYTVGSETILGLCDAIDAYNEFKNNPSSNTSRDKLKYYSAYSEFKGLYTDMKDGKATYKNTEYTATPPIGPNHSNAYMITDSYDNLTYPNLESGNDTNNPYNLSNKDIDVNYVTKAYYAQSVSDVTGSIGTAFDEIVESIKEPAFVPVEGLNDFGVNSSLTYVDPVGQYMEVNNVSSMLLYGNLYNLVKAAVYDYKFNIEHLGPEHNSTSGTFEPGWYKVTTQPDGSEKVEYDANNGSFATGWTYYLNADLTKQYVPTLDVNDDNISQKQQNTKYIFYRLDMDAEDRNKIIINPAYGDSVPATANELNYTTFPGVFKLNDIRIWVEDTGNYKDDNFDSGGIETDSEFFDALYVNLPASSIPLQVANITLDAHANITEYKTNLSDKKATTPLRIFYSVGISKDMLIDDNKEIDLSKIDKKYRKEHIKDGELYLYSNYYTNSVYDKYISDTQEAESRGDPLITLSPGSTNRYYIFQKNLILYKEAYLVEEGGNLKRITNEDALYFEGKKYDGEYSGMTVNGQPNQEALNSIKDALSKNEVTVGEVITLKDDIIKYGQNPNSDEFYFIAGDYYIPKPDNKGEKVQILVSRKGSEFGSGFSGETVKRGEYVCWVDSSGRYEETYDFDATIPTDRNNGNWILATKIGGLRVGDLHQCIGRKTLNETGTSKNYYLPTIGGTTNDTNDISLNTYLGNNGIIKYKVDTWEIPEAGGSGVAIYIISGMLLIIVPRLLNKKNQLKFQRKGKRRW